MPQDNTESTMAPSRAPALMDYYEAIERASAEMLVAARAGDWDEVVRLEGACAVLIGQLKQVAETQSLAKAEARRKARIMQRIVLTDAQVRLLSELPTELSGAPDGQTLH